MEEGANNLIESSCAFFGRISSINGSKPGYESRKFWRIPRCTEDLTLDFVLGAMLYHHPFSFFSFGGWVVEKSWESCNGRNDNLEAIGNSLFLEHDGDESWMAQSLSINLCCLDVEDCAFGSTRSTRGRAYWVTCRQRHATGTPK